MVSLYYALPKEKESDCQKFDLKVQLIQGQITYAHSVFVLQLEFLFKRFRLELGPSSEPSSAQCVRKQLIGPGNFSK